MISRMDLNSCWRQQRRHKRGIPSSGLVDPRSAFLNTKETNGEKQTDKAMGSTVVIKPLFAVCANVAIYEEFLDKILNCSDGVFSGEPIEQAEDELNIWIILREFVSQILELARAKTFAGVLHIFAGNLPVTP